MVSTSKARMTLAQLEQLPEFKSLASAKQRLWLQTVVASLPLGFPDFVLATQTAYGNCGENARTMGYAVRKNVKVSRILQIIENYGKTERDLYLEKLQAEMDAAPAGSAKRERLVALYGQIMFGAKMPKSSKSKRMKKLTPGL